MTARVRSLQRLVLRLHGGVLDGDEVRRRTAVVPRDTDVVVVLRGGPVGVDPAGADLLGRCLADAARVQLEGYGPGVALFTTTMREAMKREAMAG